MLKQLSLVIETVVIHQYIRLLCVPVYLVIGGRKSQLVLAGADGKVGDRTHVTLDAERLR